MMRKNQIVVFTLADTVAGAIPETLGDTLTI